MFNVGDRVRVTKFMGAASFSSHIGATGTVTKVNQNKGETLFVYSYHVRVDRPQKIAPDWSNQTAVDILYYPEELEYEDNRKGAAFGDIVACGGGSSDYGDLVRLNNGMTNCVADEWGPIYHVFRLFANYRQGDTALHITCLGCGTVSGHTFNNVTPSDIDNIMYACTEPSLNYDIEPSYGYGPAYGPSK